MKKTSKPTSNCSKALKYAEKFIASSFCDVCCYILLKKRATVNIKYYIALLGRLSVEMNEANFKEKNMTQHMYTKNLIVLKSFHCSRCELGK